MNWDQIERRRKICVAAQGKEGVWNWVFINLSEYEGHWRWTHHQYTPQKENHSWAL